MKLKLLFLSVIVLFAAGWAGLGGVPEVHAEDAPGKIVYKDTKSFAPVTFDHGKHKGDGMGCSDCHDALFKKKRGSADVNNALTMKALRKGKLCGACHDGKQAFSASKNCKKCHHK